MKSLSYFEHFSHTSDFFIIGSALATSSGRHPTRDRDETRQDGTITRERLLQQQTQAVAGESQTNGLVETRGRGCRHQEEITEVKQHNSTYSCKIVSLGL